MNIFLTGPTGYIGSAVAERLIAAGHVVRGLVRSDEAAAQAKSRGVVPVPSDLADSDVLRAAVQQADAVVHTAAIGPLPEPDLQAQIDRCRAALDVLVEATEARGIRLVTTSGASFYGDTGTTPVTEASPLVTEGPFATFAEAEMALTDKSHVVIVRPAIVHGRGGSKPMLVSMAGIEARGRAGYVDEDKQVSFVHVDDLADLYVRAVEGDAPGAVLLGAAETLPMTDVMRAAAASMGLPEELDRMEAQAAGEAFAILGFYASMDMRIDASGTRAATGWSPDRPSVVHELREGSYVREGAAA